MRCKPCSRSGVRSQAIQSLPCMRPLRSHPYRTDQQRNSQPAVGMREYSRRFRRMRWLTNPTHSGPYASRSALENHRSRRGFLKVCPPVPPIRESIRKNPEIRRPNRSRSSLGYFGMAAARPGRGSGGSFHQDSRGRTGLGRRQSAFHRPPYNEASHQGTSGPARTTRAMASRPHVVRSGSTVAGRKGAARPKRGASSDFSETFGVVARA